MHAIATRPYQSAVSMRRSMSVWFISSLPSPLFQSFGRLPDIVFAVKLSWCDAPAIEAHMLPDESPPVHVTIVMQLLLRDAHSLPRRLP